MRPDAPWIVGDFKILRELGRGGMGVVYLARQLSLARPVALKVLSQDAVAGSDVGVLRFRREAALLARLVHPQVVRVFTVGSDKGLHYLAMEYIEGTNLGAVLAARGGGAQDGLPATFREDFVRAATTVVRDAARGLGAAHASGIVHRDVKPSNILLANDGRNLLADFGLARDVAAQSLTQAGTTLGSIPYMAPERFGDTDLAPAADVFGLGVVLYECITGRRPFDEASVETLMENIRSHDPRPPRAADPSIGRDLETIILKCLEKVPGARYQDGTALADELTRYLDGDPIDAAPVSAITRLYRRARRRRVPALVFATVVGVAALAFGVGWTKYESQQRHIAWSDVRERLNSDDESRALALMNDELDRHPEHERVRFERIDLAMRNADWASAAADLEYVDRHSDNERGSARVGLSLVRAIQVRGTPERPPGTPAETARESFYRSLVHQSRRELEQAIAASRAAYEMDDTLIEALYTLGGSHFRREEFDEAEDAFTIYDRVRSRASVKEYLGRIDMELKRYESAAVYFERYTRMVPGDVTGWNNLAAAHMCRAMQFDRRGSAAEFRAELASAEAALERAKEKGGDYFLVAFNEALVSLLHGDVEQSEQQFERAIQLFGEDSAIDPEWGMRLWTFYAGTLAEAGEADLALQYLELARAANPFFASESDWVYAYADALDRLEQRDEAIRLLDDALRENPASSNLVELRERIAGGT